jgi:Domain of unknown function (DUF4411)
MGRYWVDANVFIWGSREPYPLPGARSYWNWFESQVDAGKIISHPKCINEVTEGEKRDHPQPIVQWVKTRKDKLMAPADNKQSSSLVGAICDYCYKKFGSSKTIEFTKGADLWLIARAKLDEGTVVTQESAKKLVRIPAVCEAFEVRHISIYTMNKELGMTL